MPSFAVWFNRKVFSCSPDHEDSEVHKHFLNPTAICIYTSSEYKKTEEWPFVLTCQNETVSIYNLQELSNETVSIYNPQELSLYSDLKGIITNTALF